ncbi:MAG: pyruvate dehydrogenase (acetyl-transferring), homodimeric type [bacterium]
MSDSLDTTNDIDQEETLEWLEAINAVIERDGPERARYLLESMMDEARQSGTNIPFRATTAYINTIPPHREARSPGDSETEWRIRSIIRWNALAMVVKTNRAKGDLGGHIASFASAATLYDVGFNHFFKGHEAGGGDLLYIQGHSSPGIYARAFLEGRLSQEQMENFRRDVDGKGLPSYPHPWLMDDFWQFPTVSMGLGPIQAIYQARFLKYLHNRGLADTSQRKVWCFVGDGETDEPETLGAISLAGREELDNLIFVVNCNLQRLDGPVRGNGKIIQELEGVFRGACWNVLKVIWGSYWDPLLAKDKNGLLKKRMEEAVDGDYQNYKAKGGAYTREHFFGKYPELKDMVASLSDRDIWRLNRGGHDPHKIFAAYSEAINHTGQPTVILAKTVKGYGMGEAGESHNTTHQQKKMADEYIKTFRDRFQIPITDEQLSEVPLYRPDEDSKEIKYIRERRKALGGYLPSRKCRSAAVPAPALSKFESVLKGTGERKISSTMGFVRSLAIILRDKNYSDRVVPIVADEARTFGMEGMFRQLGIYSSQGQKYVPEDQDQLMYYREDKKGQILQEGLSEAGALSSWIAAATSYCHSDVAMVPFFIFYSMFGFQRVGDLIWAAGDARARGFLIGGTSGRTTLNGEGLQHEDGHSQVIAATVPNCIAYDPTYAYEVAVIVQDGLKRMYEDQEDVFYYITTMNENYKQPALPKGSEEGILKGMYLLSEAGKGNLRVQLLGSGAILRESIAAAELLDKEFGVKADVWSCPSFNELGRDGRKVERENRLKPESKQKKCHVQICLDDRKGPVIAATDYVRAFTEEIRPWVKARYVTLGTDGFGRSDTRAALRNFFEVDSNFIAYTAIETLYRDGEMKLADVKKARKIFGVDAKAPAPWTV